MMTVARRAERINNTANHQHRQQNGSLGNGPWNACSVNAHQNTLCRPAAKKAGQKPPINAEWHIADRGSSNGPTIHNECGPP